MFQKQPRSVAVLLFSAFKSPLVAAADSRAGSLCGDVVRGGRLLRIMLLEGGVGSPVSQWEGRRKWPTNGTYIKEEERGVSNEGMDHSAQWLTHTQQLHSKTESPGSRLWLSLQCLPPCPLLVTPYYQAPGLPVFPPSVIPIIISQSSTALCKPQPRFSRL